MILSPNKQEASLYSHEQKDLELQERPQLLISTIDSKPPQYQSSIALGLSATSHPPIEILGIAKLSFYLHHCLCHVSGGRLLEGRNTGFASLFLLVYVDDLVITGTDENEIENFKLFLSNKFKIKDMGELKYFLRIKGRLRCKGVTKQIIGVVPKGLALRVVLVDLHSKDESGKGFKLEVLASPVLCLVRLWNAAGELPQKVPSNAWYVSPLASINCAIHEIIHVENLP
ncbi:ribonuclease H-like domain-containing protein [Tanacetum coccineum]